MLNLHEKIFATKSIDNIKAEADSQGEHSLKRVLGPWNLVLLGIGGIIGTGIFVLTGHAAGQHAGPAIVISMSIAGVVSALAALCYAEFASTVPIAGSAYTYSYATLGELFAWIIGWDLILEYALGAATVAVGWSGHLVAFMHDFLHVDFPAMWSAAPGTIVQTANGDVTAVFNLPAVLVTALVSTLLVIGIKESATVNAIIVVLKVAVVLIVIVCGAAWVDPSNWSPLIPENTGKFGEYGWSGIMRAAGVVFFAYIGFDAVSTAAQEAKNPQRDMPIGILGSLAICTILYILVSGIIVGLVPYQALKDTPAPMVVAMNAAAERAANTSWAGLLGGMRFLVEFGAILGLFSVMVVLMLGQTRVFLSMAHDGLLPQWAGKIHHRFRTPHVGTIVTGAIVALAAGFTPIGVLGELVSIGTLLAFVLVALGVIFLRRAQPELHRPFRTPWVPWLPIASVVVNILLMVNLPWETWLRLFMWMATGMAIYFVYGIKHSRLRKA